MQVKNLLNLMSNRLSTLPLMVLYITDGCNSRCKTCDIWKNPRRNMSMPLVDELVAQAQDLKTRWVLLSGGEAMQHPEWQEIARRFRSVGVRVMLLTNGLLVRKQIDLVSQSIDDLILSLDGGKAETYEHIRGVDAFELVLDGIRMAHEAGIPVTTRTTVQRGNFREIPLIVEKALSAGADAVSFLAVDLSNPFAFGERFDADLELSPQLDLSQTLTHDEINELDSIISQLERDFAPEFTQGKIAESPEKLRRILIGYFRALLGDADYQSPRCNAPHFSTVIEVDGSLRPCYFLPKYGRMRPDGETLSQAINTQKAIELREAYANGQRRECGTCVCPLYKGPRSLLRM